MSSYSVATVYSPIPYLSHINRDESSGLLDFKMYLSLSICDTYVMHWSVRCVLKRWIKPFFLIVCGEDVCCEAKNRDLTEVKKAWNVWNSARKVCECSTGLHAHACCKKPEACLKTIVKNVNKHNFRLDLLDFISKANILFPLFLVNKEKKHWHYSLTGSLDVVEHVIIRPLQW